MNTVSAQPNISQASGYRPTNISTNGLPTLAQGTYIARPNGGSSASAPSSSAAGLRPGGSAQVPAPGGSFIDRLVSQLEQLVERVVLGLVERVLGGISQKLESALGVGGGLGGEPAALAGALTRDLPTTGTMSVSEPGAVLVDLPPLQLTVTQTNSQNQTQNVTQPEEGGGFFSSVIEVLGGIGDTIGSLWGKAKETGSSVVGSLLSKATSFFGF